MSIYWDRSKEDFTPDGRAFIASKLDKLKSRRASKIVRVEHLAHSFDERMMEGAGVTDVFTGNPRANEVARLVKDCLHVKVRSFSNQFGDQKTKCEKLGFLSKLIGAIHWLKSKANRLKIQARRRS